MPSVSQKQSDMMAHASHSEEYANSRNVPQSVARQFNGEDIRAALWGKTEDGPCGKALKGEDGEEYACEFSGPRPWAAEAPEPPPVEDEDLGGDTSEPFDNPDSEVF